MHPTKQEQAEIYALWKAAFGFDDGGWIDDYFERNFRLEYCYRIRKDDEIIATLCAHPHQMILQGKQIPVRFIIGVITKEAYQHQGYMHALFEAFFARTQNETGLYILQAYQPSIYVSSGFTKNYPITLYQLQEMPTAQLAKTTRVDAYQLYQVSQTFFTQYDGYIKRDIAWYENLLIEAEKQNYRIHGVMEEDRLVGYSIARIQENGIYLIEELQYMHTTACESLLAHAKKEHSQVHVLSALPLPYAIPLQDQISLIIRLGNTDILKNILQRDIHSLQDVYAGTHRPLYHYGFW